MARARYGRYMSTCQTVVVCLLYTLSSVNCLQLQLCDFPNFDSALAHFAKALTFKTVSDPNTSNHAKDPQEFAKLDEFLSSTYTAVWDKLKVEKVGVDSMSYLITWQGKNESLLPVLFISHVDVVPVPEESLMVSAV
eukprot:jgi/Chrzof1/10688/Cz05g08200.t1